MKNVIIIGFSVLLLSCNHSSSSKKNVKDYGTYSNKSKGFSLEYPKQWDTTQKVPNVIFSAIENKSNHEDMFNESINVSVYPSNGKTMKDIIEDNIRIANQIYKTPEIKQSKTKNNNGLEYDNLEIKLKNQGLTLISNSSFFSDGKTIYTVTQIAEDLQIQKYRPIMEEVINSFNWAK